MSRCIYACAYCTRRCIYQNELINHLQVACDLLSCQMFNLHYFQYLLWNCLCKPSDTNAVTTNKSNTEVNTNVHRLKGNEIEHSLSGPREFTAAMNWRCSCIVQMSLDFLRSSISVTVPLFSLISLSNVAVASVVVRYDS